MNTDRETGGKLLDLRNELVQPNVFELAGERAHIAYFASSISGQPQLYYRDERLDLAFTGEEIAKLPDSRTGTVVTVTLERQADRHTLTLTLVVPDITLEDEASSFSTLAIPTTHRTSLAGPSLVKAPFMHTYDVLPLRGTAGSSNSDRGRTWPPHADNLGDTSARGRASEAHRMVGHPASRQMSPVATAEIRNN